MREIDDARLEEEARISRMQEAIRAVRPCTPQQRLAVEPGSQVLHHAVGELREHRVVHEAQVRREHDVLALRERVSPRRAARRRRRRAPRCRAAGIERRGQRRHVDQRRARRVHQDRVRAHRRQALARSGACASPRSARGAGSPPSTSTAAPRALTATAPPSVRALAASCAGSTRPTSMPNACPTAATRCPMAPRPMMPRRSPASTTGRPCRRATCPGAPARGRPRGAWPPRGSAST